MRGDMSYEQYKFHYDLQRIWTWMTVPGCLILAVLSALDLSHKWTKPHDEPPLWVISFVVVIVFSALFMYSGATAHKGLSIFKWFAFILGGGALGAVLVGIFYGGNFDYPNPPAPIQAILIWMISIWLGYSLCAILTFMSMSGLKGYLVDGDDHEWVRAVKEYENEQKSKESITHIRHVNFTYKEHNEAAEDGNNELENRDEMMPGAYTLQYEAYTVQEACWKGFDWTLSFLVLLFLISSLIIIVGTMQGVSFWNDVSNAPFWETFVIATAIAPVVMTPILILIGILIGSTTHKGLLIAKLFFKLFFIPVVLFCVGAFLGGTRVPFIVMDQGQTLWFAVSLMWIGYTYGMISEARGIR